MLQLDSSRHSACMTSLRETTLNTNGKKHLVSQVALALELGLWKADVPNLESRGQHELGYSKSMADSN